MNRIAVWRAHRVPVAPERSEARQWFVIGRGPAPLRAVLDASAGPGPVIPVVVLGDRFGPDDNEFLLRGLAVARAGSGRIVLVHTGSGGGSLLNCAVAEDGRLSAIEIELSGGATPPAVEAAIAFAGHHADGYRHVEIDGNGNAWRTGWSDVDIPRVDPARLHGEVLITGGLGGLGIRVAGMLRARTGIRPVLLDDLGRGEISGDVRAALARLKSSGGTTVIDADVTDRAQVAAALAARQVTGIVHCAGDVRGGFTAEATASRLAALQAPKVAGLRNVLAAVDRGALRRLITFGSITARSPHPNMGAYALANELLRRSTIAAADGLPDCGCTAVEWSLFSGAGQAHRMGAVRQARSMGMPPVPLRAGMEVLLRLFTDPRRGSLAVTGLGDRTFPPAP
ncbi:KR domain-containing protein [Saccharopolyspora sp. NPDC050642]|uniref:KR domain-containing protein n=1 Tax=Saccharopolyspora sp. NPDC050642 TaxID=3157099 RepID=UPI0033C45B0F